MYASTLTFGLSAPTPTHQKRTKSFRRWPIMMIGSRLSEQGGGEEAVGRNGILQALHELPDHLLGLCSDS